MHLLLSWFVIVLTIVEIHSINDRVGACPGIPLDSCECFKRLYDRHVETANMSDIVARNWQITLWYQDISHSFQKLLHTAPDSTPGFPSIGVWPSVGAWASHVVGFSIREQSLPELWSYVIRNLPHWMQKVLDRIPFTFLELLFKEILRHTSVALAGGNLFVFREIASSYAHYGMEFCTDTTKPDEERLIKFIQNYVCADGQCDLAKGIRALFKAHYGTADAMTFGERDQLLLAQGMYVGLAEQTHLQPFIEAALPGYTISWCRFWPSRNASECPDLINNIVTKLLIHIMLGSHRLLADQNIPSSVHNGSDFSPYLTTLTLPETHDLMAKMLNSTTLQLNNTSANDWTSLAQRVRFISPLFWVFQDHEELNCYIFTAEQEFLIRTNQSHKIDKKSWLQLCDKDCCAANGGWNGKN